MRAKSQQLPPRRSRSATCRSYGAWRHPEWLSAINHGAPPELADVGPSPSPQSVREMRVKCEGGANCAFGKGHGRRLLDEEAGTLVTVFCNFEGRRRPRTNDPMP